MAKDSRDFADAGIKLDAFQFVRMPRYFSYYILKNRTYVGKAVHNAKSYPRLAMLLSVEGLTKGHMLKPREELTGSLRTFPDTLKCIIHKVIVGQEE